MANHTDRLIEAIAADPVLVAGAVKAQLDASARLGRDTTALQAELDEKLAGLTDQERSRYDERTAK